MSGDSATKRGQSLVEFALILPLLLIIVLGIIDLGKAFGYKNDETNLANQAARAAAVNSCPAGRSNISNWIISQAPPNELKNGGGSIANTGLSQAGAITFMFPSTGTPDHCIGDPRRSLSMPLQLAQLPQAGGRASGTRHRHHRAAPPCASRRTTTTLDATDKYIGQAERSPGTCTS